MNKKALQISGATEIKVCECAAVQDVCSTAKELYFSNTNGISFRLTYEGTHGWRLQATSKGFKGFCDKGAGQSIAAFMGEELPDLREEISVTKEEKVIKVTASGADSVLLSTDEKFSLRFVSPKGVVISEILSVRRKNGKLIVQGSLTKDEGIYGGGERFDVVNKRGTAFPMYIEDGWNRSDTSYMAIPLFLTTRGGGMYVNRYERMEADFGKAYKSKWSIALGGDLYDCYFYPSDNLSDALLGYTQLTGHAELPPAWSQGVIICRYAPDMRSFGDMPDFTTPISFQELIDGPMPANADADCLQYSIERKNKKTGECSYVEMKRYEETDEYTYDYNVVYYTRAGGHYRVSHYSKDGESYFRVGPKGSPGGLGVVHLTNNFIEADMKPTAMLMEAWNWGNISLDEELCRNNEAELIKSVNFLHNLGLKVMVYMGIAGGFSPCSKGFKEEYMLHADITDADGNVTTTTRIPQTSGADNPDVSGNSVRSYMDITNPEAVDWYFNKIWEQMIRIGVDGVKIDFCEMVPDEVTYPNGMSVKYRFYDGSYFTGKDIHHAYPTYAISQFYKNILRLQKEKGIDSGFAVLSRGGGIGSQRNPFMWSGDQTRTFEKIEDQLLAVINSGISGVPFMSYDMAGYQYDNPYGYFKMGIDRESELFARATECTTFTTNMQTHGDVRHAYEMNEDTKEIYRRYTSLRQELIPYVQKVSKEACDTGMPVVRQMALFDYEDKNLYGLETQFMLGDALLVAPILTENTYQKSVYLPKGSWTNLLTGRTVTGGKKVTVKANLAQTPLFLNNASADAKALKKIFKGANWKKIKNWQ